MDIQPKEMNQLVPIHVSVLILVLHHERSMNLKLVVFSFTIVIQVLCMWFQRRRREDDICSTFALSFVGFLVWLGQSTIALRCDQEPSTLSLLEAVKKTCRPLGIRIIEETVPPGSHASNGAAEVTVKVIRRHANLLIQQIEKGCGLGEVIGCHHPLYQWALLHSCWLHNRFVVRQGHTAYELCANRPYTGRLALFGERVLGFLKLSTKGSPTWTKGHMARKDS